MANERFERALRDGTLNLIANVTYHQKRKEGEISQFTNIYKNLNPDSHDRTQVDNKIKKLQKDL